MDDQVIMVLDFPILMVAAPSLSFVIAFFSILWLIKRNPNWALDHPNSRSLHTIPIPRIGGLGLLLGVIVVWLLFSVTALPISVWIGISLLIAVSLADDIWHIPVSYRLLIQSVAAIGFSLAQMLDSHGWAVTLCAIIWIIWMSNLYNFMDGSDGLAGGMAVIGFGYYGLFAYLTGHYDFAIVNFTIASAAMAFLVHNFFPARIFLGDAGSISLGFLAAVLGILGGLNDTWSVFSGIGSGSGAASSMLMALRLTAHRLAGLFGPRRGYAAHSRRRRSRRCRRSRPSPSRWAGGR